MATPIEPICEDGSRFLSEGEVEIATNRALTKRTLQNWRLRGGGPPFYKFGKKVAYREDELAAWIDSRRCASTSEANAA